MAQEASLEPRPTFVEESPKPVPGLPTTEATAWQLHSLHHAAVSGDVTELRAVLARGADVDMDARTKHGDTPFILACDRGHMKCAEALLDAGCDAAATTNNGCTGLMLAAHNGLLALVERLLASGAELEARNKHGTAFHFACDHGQAACGHPQAAMAALH